MAWLDEPESESDKLDEPEPGVQRGWPLLQLMTPELIKTAGGNRMLALELLRRNLDLEALPDCFGNCNDAKAFRLIEFTGGDLIQATHLLFASTKIIQKAGGGTSSGGVAAGGGTSSGGVAAGGGASSGGVAAGGGRRRSGSRSPIGRRWRRGALNPVDGVGDGHGSGRARSLSLGRR